MTREIQAHLGVSAAAVRVPFPARAKESIEVFQPLPILPLGEANQGAETKGGAEVLLFGENAVEIRGRLHLFALLQPHQGAVVIGLRKALVVRFLQDSVVIDQGLVELLLGGIDEAAVELRQPQARAQVHGLVKVLLGVLKMALAGAGETAQAVAPRRIRP